VGPTATSIWRWPAATETRAWLLIVGALGDPPEGALLVFADSDSAGEFAAADPYRAAGLITGHEIQPWNVVMHRPLPDDG
jgi:uncharacterized protein YciI